MRPKFAFLIDVVGTCNLRCPSCPVGNFSEARGGSGLMAPALLDRILAKAVSECRLTSVALYNWAEPLLHPRLPELIRIVNSYRAGCLLSSNLNVLKDIDAVLAAQPRELRISVSGFHQQTYGITHRGGRIERVKRNMVELAVARRRTGSKTRIRVAFHRYLDNQQDERAMRKFAESLGFDFVPLWAYLMPLEKNLAYLGDTSTAATITAEDRALIDRLALHPHDASQVAIPHRDAPCKLRDAQMAIDFQGRVMLCCMVYDRQSYSLGPYLDSSLAELQQAKHRHSLCGRCMRKGLHVVAVQGAPEFEEVAVDRIQQSHPDRRVEDLPACPTGREPRGLRRFASHVAEEVRRGVSKLQRQ